MLDLCAGTLPLSLELTRQAKQRLVLAVDFCEDMLRSGMKTLPQDDRRARIFPVCGDGEEIPGTRRHLLGLHRGLRRAQPVAHPAGTERDAPGAPAWRQAADP